MLRSILNDFPEWLLALLLIGAIVALTLGEREVIVASGLLTALILQYPYSGSIAVKRDPLAKGPLSHLGPGG